MTPILEAAGPYRMAGTPAWCALDDTDPVNVAALFGAAQHWSLQAGDPPADRRRRALERIAEGRPGGGARY